MSTETGSDAPRKGSFAVQPQEKCTACGKTVYATEKMIVEETNNKLTYHKTCLRCKTCNKVLALGNYSSLKGEFYCKPHFKQLFASKGNYDEAFGQESAKSKWAPAVTTDAPKSFVPSAEGSSKPAEQKKETSAETAAKFQKWREDSSSERCSECDKNVYAAERLILEQKNQRRLLHKECFKCTTCRIALDIRNYGTAAGKIYCMTHLKEINKEASNQAASAYVPTPNSFVPPTGDGEKKPAEQKNETSEKTASLINKFRQESDNNSCDVCSKAVYATERIVVDDKDTKRLLHKNCLRCKQCSKQLELGTFAALEGVFYCKPHFKQLFASKGNYDEGFGRERKGTGSVVMAPTSFVPKVEEESRPQKKEANPEVAEKFKGLGGAGAQDRCKICDKPVYSTEKLTIEELKNPVYYHKTCFKCSHCGIKLDVATYGSSGGIIFCKVHLKQYGKPEASKDVGFISPLHRPNESDKEPERDQAAVDTSDLRGGNDQSDNNRNDDRDTNDRNADGDDGEREREAQRQREREELERERERQQQQEREEGEREREKERERERQREAESKKSEPAPSAGGDDDEAAREREREERKRERERRKKEREEEEAKAEEERKKRAEERRKRLAALDS